MQTILGMSVHFSPLWKYVTRFSLMDPVRNAEDPAYAAFVDEIGEGAGVPELPRPGERHGTVIHSGQVLCQVK